MRPAQTFEDCDGRIGSGCCGADGVQNLAIRHAAAETVFPYFDFSGIAKDFSAELEKSGMLDNASRGECIHRLGKSLSPANRNYFRRRNKRIRFPQDEIEK